MTNIIPLRFKGPTGKSHFYTAAVLSNGQRATEGFNINIYVQPLCCVYFMLNNVRNDPYNTYVIICCFVGPAVISRIPRLVLFNTGINLQVPDQICAGITCCPYLYASFLGIYCLKGQDPLKATRLCCLDLWTYNVWVIEEWQALHPLECDSSLSTLHH